MRTFGILYLLILGCFLLFGPHANAQAVETQKQGKKQNKVKIDFYSTQPLGKEGQYNKILLLGKSSEPGTLQIPPNSQVNQIQGEEITTFEAKFIAAESIFHTDVFAPKDKVVVINNMFRKASLIIFSNFYFNHCKSVAIAR